MTKGSLNTSKTQVLSLIEKKNEVRWSDYIDKFLCTEITLYIYNYELNIKIKISAEENKRTSGCANKNCCWTGKNSIAIVDVNYCNDKLLLSLRINT